MNAKTPADHTLLGTRGLEPTRSKCPIRMRNGECPVLSTKCTLVADSLCAPLRAAYTHGEYSEYMANLKQLELTPRLPVMIYGRCPFCGQSPAIKRATWFQRFFFGMTTHVHCPSCKAVLVAVCDGYEAGQVGIHEDPKIDPRKAEFLKEGFNSEEADEIIAEDK